MKSTILGAAAVLALSGAAFAADLEPAPAGGVFGYVSGSYFFEDAIQDWRLFSDTEKESFGDGYGLQGRLGYRWSEWDFAIGGQYADFGAGNRSDTGDLRADNLYADAQAGYNFMWGETAARTAFGVRYAEWNNDVHDSNGARIKHDFWGVGPRVEINTDTPLSENLSLLFDGGVGVLFGKIKTDANSDWNCNECSDENTTSFNADAKLALGWAMTPGVKLAAGYQVQYWGNVNVATTDSTGFGDNEGKSDHLIHGPFGMISFDLSR
ncbi:porin family protein [Nordella sp. HKS 07]|uniref:Lpg1974 family pore-forming outer membrane protein n=1 Tax=Nordella sp. HKS 07 TaxID=2712222 RepID=UPI0013E0F7AF|nr:Lpg1974 family pore-forming outer membrane protein [Nordella sp. HKS 07]QIG47528.1 porin family protein [Nordella sp. HKS 07]